MKPHRDAGLPGTLIVNCSHANSGKKHTREQTVRAHIIEQRAAGSPSVIGVRGFCSELVRELGQFELAVLGHAQGQHEAVERVFELLRLGYAGHQMEFEDASGREDEG